MCNVTELTDSEVFALRNEVINEAEKRVARISLKENIANALSGAEDESSADAAYAEAKATIFPTEAVPEFPTEVEPEPEAPDTIE